MIARVLTLKLAGKFRANPVFLRFFQMRGDRYIKNDINAVFSIGNTKIMQRAVRVDRLQKLYGIVSNCIGFFTFRRNWVHMNDNRNARFFLDTTFGFIDDFMHLYDIDMIRYFGMHGGKDAARPVIMHDKVMDADDIRVAEDDNTQVGIEIHSGRNRIVRRIFEHFGYQILKLDRVFFAGITKKDLPRGRWRFLTQAEVNTLKTY